MFTVESYRFTHILPTIRLNRRLTNKQPQKVGVRRLTKWGTEQVPALNSRLTNKEPQNAEVMRFAAGLCVDQMSEALGHPISGSNTHYLGFLRFLVRQSAFACWSFHRSLLRQSTVLEARGRLSRLL